MENQFIQPCDVTSKGLRFVNYLLDVIFASILMVIGLGVIGFQTFLVNPMVRHGFGPLTVFVYYFVCESLWQRSLAKFITGTKVVALDGTQPTVQVIAVRSLLRLIPLEFVSFFTSSPGGLHDWWSGTMVVRAQAVPGGIPQPGSYATDNAGFLPQRTGAPAWEPTVQSASVPRPTPAAAAASEPTSSSDAASEAAWTSAPVCRMPRAQRSWLGGNMKWIAIGGPIVLVLGILMVWSANKPVPAASAADPFDQAASANTRPSPRRVSVPPSAPPVSVPASELSDPFASSTGQAPLPPPAPSVSTPASVLRDPFSPSTTRAPAPKRASAPAGLPTTIQADACVVVDGKLVIYSDLGELAEGQTVSGWKVTRVTRREVVFKNADATYTCPVSTPGAN